MKKFNRSGKTILLALLLGAVGAAWFLRPATRFGSGNSSPSSPSPTAASIAQRSLVLAQPARTPSGETSTPHAPDRARVAAFRVDPEQKKAAENDPQLQAVASSLRNYRLAFQQNPVGNNADITRILLGKNARGLRYLPADTRLSERNELIDRWDQPIFFHQISGTMMEVRSAGPDHIMWNADDEVLR